jgi:hypothetical protein
LGICEASSESLKGSTKPVNFMLPPGALVDSLSGLAPGERLGPFVTQGGIDIWFDVFFAARRMEVREAGAGAPDIVF